MEEKNMPFIMDFVFELPEGLEIESGTQAADCVTYGGPPCDDD